MKWFLTAALLFAGAAQAQKLDPVQWSLKADSTKAAPGSTVPLKLTAQIQPGWHLYSLTTPQGGKDGSPIQTTIKLADNPAVESSQVLQPKPERKFDPSFGIDIETFSGDSVFWVPTVLAKSASGEIELTAQVRYQACDDKQCLQPKKKTASFKLIADASAPAGSMVLPPGVGDGVPSAGLAPAAVASKAEAPVPVQEAWLPFVSTAFGVGLLAIFTPCVFPMIPITVSFFLNQKGGVGQALVFALGIITLFCALGLGVTALSGPFGVVQLSANPWVNGFIAAVFFTFALSLLGAFEITLPSAMLTKLHSASRRGGFFGTMLMGLTFALTSFACIGPFMGPLLVASAQGPSARPVIGMASFATGLASPFFLLAAFPSYLGKLPRSGGWLARVKVVMGFVLLAVMFKYLSNIDQVLQTGFITRERFLAAWVVLFSMAGLYLLGLLRLEGIEASDHLGTGRLLTGSALLIFAISLIPGMFGGRLGELDAYVPVALASDTGTAAHAGPVWLKDQYRAALDKGRAENKLVLVNFTGYTCTNCHWMKANMFGKPEMASALNELVLVELYTDGTEPINEENQKLEEQKFNTTSMPYFVIMDADEKVVASFPTATRNADEFLAFLRSKKG